MDDLLAQLKEEFEPKRQSETPKNKSSNRKSPPPPQNLASKVSIEQTLAELRIELESGRERVSNIPRKSQLSPQPNQTSASSNSSKYRNRLNTLIDQDYQMQERKREAKFAEIKRQQETRIAEQKRRQQELIEAQRREE